MQDSLEKSLSLPSTTKAVVPSAFSTTQLFPSGLTQIDTPNDHNCLFWSAALALLVPLLGESETDKVRFKTMYTRLFGTTGTVTLQGGASLPIHADSTQEGIRQALKTYNFSKQDPLNFAGNPLYALIAEKFRCRVVAKLWEIFPTKAERMDISAEYGGDWDKYIEKMRTPSSSWGWGGEPEIRAIGALIGINVIVYGEGTGYPKNYALTGASQTLSLAHVSADSKLSTVKNHYHYGVENSVYQAHLQNLHARPSSFPVPVSDKKEVAKDNGKAQKDEKELPASTASPDQFPKIEGIASRELLRLEKQLQLNPEKATLWNQKGHLLSELEYDKEALEAFETASKINPKKPSYFQNKGNLLYNLNRYEEALVAYETACKIRPKESVYFNDKGDALYELKRYEEALIAYETALKIKPKCIAFQINKGLTLEKLGRNQEALGIYDAALKVSPGNATCLKNKIRVLNTLGRQEEAVAVAKIAPKSESKRSHLQKADAHFNKGLRFSEIGQYERALTEYNAALHIKPTASCLNMKGYLLYNLSRYEEALAAYKEALKIDAKHLYALVNKGDVLQKLGQADKARTAYETAFFLSGKAKKKHQRVPKAASLVGLGRYEEALTYLEPLLEQAPTDQYILLIKGRALQGLGREEAAAYFELAKKPQLIYEAEDFNQKGDNLRERKQFAEALVAYEAALKIQPLSYDSLFCKAYVLGKLGRDEESLAAYEAVLTLKPRCDASLNNKGYHLYKLGRYEEALVAYEAGLNINLKDEVLLNNKGDTLAQLKRYQEALVAYEACLKIRPKDSALLNNKGDTLNELGRYEEALVAYEAALQFQPSNFAYLNKKAQILQKLGREKEALDCLEKVKEAKACFTMPIRSEPSEMAISTTENMKDVILITTTKLSPLKSSMNPTRSSGRIKYEPAHFGLDRTRKRKTVSDLQGKPRYKSELGKWKIKAGDLFNLGRYEEALAVYEDILVTIKFKDGHFYKEILYGKSNALCELARYEEALIGYDELVKMGGFGKSSLPYCLGSKGVALEHLGRYEEALAVYEGLSKMGSKVSYEDYIPCEHYLKSSVLNKLGRYEEALAACEVALKNGKFRYYSFSRIDCLNNKGVTLENLGRYQEALGIYTRVLEQEQETREWFIKRGIGESGIKTEPAVILCLGNRGDVLHKLGRYEEALADYEAALKFQPENTTYLHKRAQILQKLERVKESVTAVKEHKSKSPSENMPHLERDIKKIQPSIVFAPLPPLADPFLSQKPLTRGKDRKRKSYDTLVSVPKLSHPITPKEWETHLRKIRTTKGGRHSAATQNCDTLTDAIAEGTVRDTFLPAPSRTPVEARYTFRSRTVERRYGKNKDKRYLAVDEALTFYQGNGLHRWLEPSHQALINLTDDL